VRAGRALLAAALALLPAAGRAGFPAPRDYSAEEGPPGTVVITLAPRAGRTCPDQGLLREDVATGEIVNITTCEEGAPAAFRDECVPAGTYRYGLAAPYACEEQGTAYYFHTAAIAGAPAGCVRTIAAPEPATEVPWPAGIAVLCEPTFACGAGTAAQGGSLLALAAGLALRRWRVGRRRA
jgi:hypothetical protein